jgi:hypothetical protein
MSVLLVGLGVAAAPLVLLALLLALPPSVPTTLQVCARTLAHSAFNAGPTRSIACSNLRQPGCRPTGGVPSNPPNRPRQSLPGLGTLYLQLLRAAVRKGKVPKTLKGHKAVEVRQRGGAEAVPCAHCRASVAPTRAHTPRAPAPAGRRTTQEPVERKYMGMNANGEGTHPHPNAAAARDAPRARGPGALRRVPAPPGL